MEKRIIYNRNDGGISVIVPNLASGLTIEQIAAKDVPEGQKYKIVDVTDIPTDRTERDLWTADFTSFDGTGIGADAWFAAQQQNGGG